MCVIEFIGYTCGHTSLPVLRACPLTTASHTFPTCPRRGDKAFFAGEMCSACQRIIHSRATQIEEYEHRFMHERGVCGCETVFPYLIRPRAIGSCGGGCSGEELGCSGHKEPQESQEEPENYSGGQKNVSPRKMELPPLLCEAMDEGGRAVVSVRLPSLYAAEWVADHRARHDDGLCSCCVDFRTYQEATLGGAANDDVTRVTREQEQSKDSHLNQPIRRSSSMSALSAMSQDGNSNEKKDKEVVLKSLTRSSSYSDFSCFMNDRVDVSHQTDETTARPPADAREFSCWPTLSPQPHLGRPVRHAGAVFAKVPEYLKLMGPFLAQPSPFAHDADQEPVLDGIIASGGGKKPRKGVASGYRAFPPGATAKQYCTQATRDHLAFQAGQKTPLVGFPIGAGPEGVPHSIPWHSLPPCWRL